MTNCINKRKGAWHVCVRIERYKTTSAEEFSKEKWKQDPSLPTSLDLLQEQREALRNYFSMPFEEILHSDALTAMLKRASLLWLNTPLTYAKESSSEKRIDKCRGRIRVSKLARLKA